MTNCALGLRSPCKAHTFMLRLELCCAQVTAARAQKYLEQPSADPPPRQNVSDVLSNLRGICGKHVGNRLYICGPKN